MVFALLFGVAVSVPLQVRTEGDLRSAVTRGDTVLLPVEGGTRRLSTVSNPGPRLTAKGRAFTAKIDLDGTLLAIEQSGTRVKTVTAEQAAELVFSEEGGWPNHKTYNDSLYTWRLGCKLTFGEVVPAGDSVYASFMLAAMYPSSHAQSVFAVGYFRLERTGAVASSLRAWPHLSSFAVRGHVPSAGSICRVFTMSGGKPVALTKRSPSEYSLVELVSGKLLAEGLPSRLVAIVGTEALFTSYSPTERKYRFTVFDLKTLKQAHHEPLLPDVEAAVVGADQALLMPPLGFGSVLLYESKGRRLFRVNVTADGSSPSRSAFRTLRP